MKKHLLALGVALGTGLVWSSGAQATAFEFDPATLGNGCATSSTTPETDLIYNSGELPVTTSTYHRYTCNYSPEAGKKITYKAADNAGNAPWSKDKVTGFTYATHPFDYESNTKMDIYIPRNKTFEELQNLPVLVYMHGGGMLVGSKASGTPVVERWINNAIVVSLNYTMRSMKRADGSLCTALTAGPTWLTPIQIPVHCSPIDLSKPYPEEQLQGYRDAANAIKWLTSYTAFPTTVKDANGNSVVENLFQARNKGVYAPGTHGQHRIILAGHSAGGTYAAALATQPHWLRKAIEPTNPASQIKPNEVLQGVIVMSSPMHFNACKAPTDYRSNDDKKTCASWDGTKYSEALSHLKPVSAKLISNSAAGRDGESYAWNFHDLIDKAWALNSVGDYGDGIAGVPLWKHMSPLFHFVGSTSAPVAPATRSMTPPMLLINGGAGCDTFTECNSGDMGEPPVMSETARMLATVANGAAGEHVAAIQPLLKKVSADQTKTCYAYPMHSGVRNLVSSASGTASIAPEMGIDRDAMGSTDLAGLVSTDNFNICKTLTGSVSLGTGNPLDNTVAHFIDEANGKLGIKNGAYIWEDPSSELWKHPKSSVSDIQ